MAENRVIGKPISQDVVSQIYKRQDKISNPTRDTETILFLNSNNAWIKLTSGVNTLTDEDILIIEEEGTAEGLLGDSTLAQNNILGGSQNKSGISTGSDVNALYRNTSSRGFRPVPGITGASIKSKGTYGTLRETQVNFVVWSLEDLDTMESLYLRPGFSMLLEWGHTAYFTSKGEFVNATTTISNFFNKYVSNTDDSSQKLIQDEIQKLRVDSSYNYDGLFGYVKNFNWSLRSDGGYDCSISIASIGSLIEGLRADVGLQNLDPKYTERADSEDSKESYKSTFHVLYENLKKFTPRSFEVDTERNRPGILRAFFSDLKINDSVIGYKKVTTTSFFGLRLGSDTTYWMSLALVFDIINTYITLGTKKGKTIEIYSGVQDADQTGAYEIESKYLTTKYHFSRDPYRVLLPFKPIVDPNLISTLGEDNQELITKHLGRIPIGKGFLPEKPIRGDIDDILNIQISTNVLLEIFDRNLEEPDSQNRDMMSLLDRIASEITDNLGGINEFAFHYDESKNMFILVDRKNTPSSKGVEYPRLSLTGLKSMVENISLSSKLSNKVSTQIAVAAQGSRNNYQDNVSEILKWNRGVIDRHGVGGTYNVEDSANTQQSRSEENTRRLEWLKVAASTYKENGSGDEYDPTKYSELKAYHNIYCSSYVIDELIAQGNPEKGIIPVELSFTTHGISGIDIAESFRIEPGILPTKYSDKFGFIITGLEHTIGSRWTTTIRTQFYILEEPSEALKTGKRGYIESSNPTESGENPTQITVQTPNADLVRFALRSLGYYEKERELSSGGDITETAAKMAIAVFTRLKRALPTDTTVTVTAGNDLYHKNLTSRHTSGRGIDFVVAPNNKNILTLVENELKIFTKANDPNFRYINEYEKLSASGTGGHFHISWGPGTEASKTLEQVRRSQIPYNNSYKIV